MRPKTFKRNKKVAKSNDLVSVIGRIAVKITDKLTVFVKNEKDIDAVKEKYTKHINDYNNYAGSPALKL